LEGTGEQQRGRVFFRKYNETMIERTSTLTLPSEYRTQNAAVHAIVGTVERVHVRMS
jgi:hypothetical protein